MRLGVELLLAQGLAGLAFWSIGCSDSNRADAPAQEAGADAEAGNSADQTVGDEAGQDGPRPALSAADWRVVIAPSVTVYRAPNRVDNNVNGWWDNNQLHFEPGDWGRYGEPIASYVGLTLADALRAPATIRNVHPGLRNPGGCQGKSVCFWAEGTYSAGNGEVYALVEDEGWETCGGLKGHWRMAIAKSSDNGATFEDAGIVLDEPGGDVCTGGGWYISAGAGDGAWVIAGDGYAYVVYGVYGGTWSPTGGTQGLGVARILLTDLAAPMQSDPVTGEPAGPSKLKKWYAALDSDGAWKVPDADGHPTSVPCAKANDCFNSDGVTGPSTPIPGSHPTIDHFTPEFGALDLWYFPYAGKVVRGADKIDVILASHLSQAGDWYNRADKVGAWLGDITHPGTFLGPTVALKPCHSYNGLLGTYTSLFGDRADTFDTSSVMAGDNPDGTPRPIPLFGVTHPPDQLPSANWTFTFCKPDEITGACSVRSDGGTFRVGTDVNCPK